MSIPLCWPDLAKTLDPAGRESPEDLRHENRKSLTQCLREVVGIEKPAVWALKKPTWEIQPSRPPEACSRAAGSENGQKLSSSEEPVNL